VSADELEPAPPAEPPPLPRRAVRAPRLGPTLVVLLGIIPLHLAVSGVLVALGLLLWHGWPLPSDAETIEATIEQILTSPKGLLLVMLPVQLVLLGLACVAAYASPTPFRRRLGLVPWRIPTSAVVGLVLATPLVQAAGGLLTALFDFGESTQLELIERLLTGQQGAGLLIMLGIVTLGAGITEELLFRGYVQTRLAERWPAAFAVVVPALFFAAMHLDPTHATAVFPLGLWFGVLALLSGSVLPAIAAHVLNNLVGVVMANALGKGASELDLGLGYLAVLAVAALCGGYGLFRLAVERTR
jgi:membrane protease YdiL (CAAX protease family)